MKRVLVTGARGQLGTEVALNAPAGIALTAVDRTQLDIGDEAAVRRVVDELRRRQTAATVTSLQCSTNHRGALRI